MPVASLIVRLCVVALCGLLMAQAKGINVIPRRDDLTAPPPPLSVAEQAYFDGIRSQVLASEAHRAKKQDRHREIALQRFSVAHDYVSQTEDAPAFSHDLYLRMSELFLATGAPDDARTAVGLALTFRPRHPETLFQLANIQLKQHDYDGVMASHTQLWRESEVNGEAWQYIDRLLTEIAATVASEKYDDIPTAFIDWHREQQQLAGESVRWSTFPISKRLACLLLSGVVTGCSPTPNHQVLPLVSIDEVTENSAVVWVDSKHSGQLRLNFRTGMTERTETLNVQTPGLASMLVANLPASADFEVNWDFDDHAGEVIRFSTWPANDNVRIAFGADLGGQNVCRDALLGYPIFAALSNARPDLFIGLGDLVYADNTCNAVGAYGNDQVARETRVATTASDFIAHWQYQYADPSLRRFRQQVPWYVTWDDHEVLNDFSPSRDYHAEQPKMPLSSRGLAAMRAYHPLPDEPGYRRIRVAQHAEVFILDTRSHRDPNEWPDSKQAPKTLLGEQQRRWLINSVIDSDATWRLIVTSVPLSIPTGTADAQARDGWANGESTTGFEHELISILQAFESAGQANIVFLSADVHFATAFRYKPFMSDFGFHEFVVGPLNSGIYPNEQLDPTLNPERLFQYGKSDIELFTDAMQWFNAGVMDIDNSGRLTFRLLNARGDFVQTLTLKPD